MTKQSTVVGLIFVKNVTFKSLFLVQCGLVLLLVAGGSAAFAQPGTGTLRVAGSTGTDGPACGSAVSPCKSIQQAVNLASPNDVLRVAAGTYTYDATLDQCQPMGQTAVVCVRNVELTLLGGFTTANWTTPDPATNLTVVDGEDLYRGVLVTDDSPSSQASLRMEGFTVTRGFAKGAACCTDIDTFSFGGGFSAVLADVILRDIKFSNNRSEGGDTASAHGGSGSGGGLSIRGLSTDPAAAVLERLTFTGNEAVGGTGPARGGLGLGGGLFSTWTTIDAANLTFTNNQALGGNSAGTGLSNGLFADALGGGASFQEGTAVSVLGSVATGNLARGGDAGNGTNHAAGSGYGGAYFGERATMALSDTFAQGNEARGGNAGKGGLGAGGAVMTTRTSTTLERMAVIDNLAAGGTGPTLKGSAGGGGGYFLRPDGSTTIYVNNSIFASNVAQLGTGGGAIGGGGGAIFMSGAALTMNHSTLARNRLSESPLQGHAIVMISHGANPSTATINYSIVADHTDYSSNTVVALHVSTGNTLHLNTGLFAGNHVDTNFNHPLLAVGTITGLATMLADTSAEFVSPGSPSFDYHLKEVSPAIDQATGSTEGMDIDRDMRDSAPDIGADEYGGSIFTDGFESGNTSKWTSSVGEV